MTRLLLALLLVLCASSAWAVDIGLDPNANAKVFFNAGGGGASFDFPAMTTDNSDCIVYVVVLANGAVTVSSITGGPSFTERTKSGTTDAIHMWRATCSAALSATVLTVTLSGTASFITASAFAITGANTSSPNDSHASVPANNTSGELSISTDNAIDLIVGGYRFAGTASPTAGSGWTQIHGANFLLTEIRRFTSTQSGLGIAVTTGAGDQNGGVGDAIKEAASAAAPRRRGGQQ